MFEDAHLEADYEDRHASLTDDVDNDLYNVHYDDESESAYGDCDTCGLPLDPNGDCGTNISHNY